jgi:hypothetical protein
VRLAIVWFAIEMSALVLGARTLVALAVPFAATAAVGAAQTARAWRRVGRRPRVWVAAGVAGALPAAAALEPAALGLAIVGGTALSVVLTPGPLAPLLRDSATTVRCWLFVGLAGASVVAVAAQDLGAAVALLLLLSAYDAGNYLVGSDSRWPIIGIVAGEAAVAVLSFSLFVVAFPPFGGAEVVLYAAVLGVLAPLGQVAGSWILPDGRALASGLRRLDSALLAGPAWMVLLELRPPT